MIDWALVRDAERRYQDADDKFISQQEEILRCVELYLTAAKERELALMRHELMRLQLLTYGSLERPAVTPRPRRASSVVALVATEEESELQRTTA